MEPDKFQEEVNRILAQTGMPAVDIYRHEGALVVAVLHKAERTFYIAQTGMEGKDVPGHPESASVHSPTANWLIDSVDSRIRQSPDGALSGWLIQSALCDCGGGPERVLRTWWNFIVRPGRAYEAWDVEAVRLYPTPEARLDWLDPKYVAMLVSDLFYGAGRTSFVGVKPLES